MCGICGLRRFGEEPIEKRHIDMLLMMNERRGNQATGVAIQNSDGKVRVYKIDEPAARVVASKEYENFLEKNLAKDTQIVLGHTRLATQGDPRKNENNHPVFAGKTAIVHNGCLQNDYVLFNTLNLKREAQVDSDIIRAILDQDGLTPKGAKNLAKITGSAAIAAISNDYPGKLLIARSGSPVVFGSTEGNLLVWSSEKVAIHTTLRSYVLKFGIYLHKQRPDLSMSTMNNNSVYLFDQKGLCWHDEFVSTRTYTPPNYSVNSGYSSTRRRWDYDDDYDGVQCPKCEKVIILSKADKDKDLWDLVCSSCETPLAVDPDIKK